MGFHISKKGQSILLQGKENETTTIEMGTRRPSALARPSIVSIYSTTFDANDEDIFQSRFYSAFHLSKTDIYHILERQEGKRTLIYHLFVFVLTLISLVFGGISTIDEWRPCLNTPLYYSELGLCIFFTYELLIRIWSAGCLAKYRTWFGRIMFITRPVILLDIFTLMGFALCLGTGITEAEFPNITVRYLPPIQVIRFLPPLQMIRFLRVDRQLSSWKVLKEIILAHRQELTVTIVIGFMFLITSAYLVFITETPADRKLYTGKFESMADSIWFSIITVRTRLNYTRIFTR